MGASFAHDKPRMFDAGRADAVDVRRSLEGEFFSLLSLYWITPGCDGADPVLYTPEGISRLARLSAELWGLSPSEDLVESLPTFEEARAIQGSLLAVGAPGGVPPVESLFKPWSADPEAKVPFAGKTGYLRGDSSVEIAALLERLQIRVPADVDLQPDHLAVLLGLLGVLSANSTDEVVAEFRARHFDWLGDFRQAYLRCGEPFYGGLADLTARAVRSANASSGQRVGEKSALPEETDPGLAPRRDSEDGIGGFLQTSPRTRELAEGLVDPNGVPGKRRTVVSTCASCVFQCGLEAETKDGRLMSVKGLKGHPTGAGTLCVRGKHYVDIAYTPTGRVTRPLKRIGDNRFEPIGWDQAYAEIADRIRGIMDESGPESVALTLGCGALHRYHATRFLSALGSQNLYEAEGACKASLDAAWAHTLGYLPDYDLANSDYILYVGRSVADGIIPAELQGLAAAHKRGAHIVMVDPRRNSSVVYADEWLAIRPGADLALLLALSNVIVSEDLYDHDFIERFTEGFERYRDDIEPYTPAWAEGVTDIPAKTITSIARGMAAAAPRAVVEKGFRGGLGIAYANNADAVRAIAFLNALLGNYGQVGGNLNPPSAPQVAAGDLDPSVFPAPRPVARPKVGEREYPFSLPDLGLTMTLGESIPAGRIRALFTYSSNPAAGYGNPDAWETRLGDLDLLVAIEIRMSETAALADYVLPEVTYLENERGASLVGAQALYLNKVIDTVHAETRPANRIFEELAEALGVGEYFNFSLDDLSEARLKPYGIGLEALKDRGVMSIGDIPGAVQKDARTGEPVIGTPSGKLSFTSDFWGACGLGESVSWVPPLVEPDEDSFRLISGNVPTLSHTYGTFSPTLLELSEERGYDRVWINAGRAEALGIAEGDEIVLTSDVATTNAQAHVTADIHPQALFIASNFGVRSRWLGAAARVGVGSFDHTPYRIDPVTAAALTQENVVRVRKA